MTLPPVDSVDVVLKTPEPEKGRDRSRKPGGRRGRSRDRQAPEPQSSGENGSEAPPLEEQLAPTDADEEAEAQHPRAYGPAADLHEEEPERHSIDYRA